MYLTIAFFLVVVKESNEFVANINSTNNPNESIFLINPINQMKKSKETSGKCGDNISFLLDSDTLTLTGSGPMYNFTQDGSPWYDERNSIKKVIMSNGISTIGAYSFYFCYELVSIEIPQSVTEIYTHAFDACRTMESVTLPDNIRIIDENVFYQCRKQSISQTQSFHLVNIHLHHAIL